MVATAGFFRYRRVNFQSAFHRGNGCYRDRKFAKFIDRANSSHQGEASVRLFIAAMVATMRYSYKEAVGNVSFSPLFIGAMVATKQGQIGQLEKQ